MGAASARERDVHPTETNAKPSLRTVPGVEVALVHWPAEQDRREELRRAGQPQTGIERRFKGRGCFEGVDFERVNRLQRDLFSGLVAPEELIDPLVRIRSTMDQHSSAIDQATLAHFINDGFFLSHIRRMRKLYAERREFFIEEFNKWLGDRFVLQIPEAGLNFVAWLRREADFARVASISVEIGIKPTPLSFYCMQAKLQPAFLFGFAAWTSAQIRESLLRLASALR